MKRSSHRDVVDEATALLNPDEADDNATIDPTLLKLDTTLPVLRNRCIGWMVDAFHTCNNKELILKDLFAENEEDLTYNDESDVPIEVLINHVTSGGVAPLPDGFVVGEDGDLARNEASEDPELDVVADDLPLAVRRGEACNQSTHPVRGDEMWEEH
ncbi:hypothetical protein B0H10DRAFT_1956858 [Mycena sp. CBHHK59/15]|nr:hypothetical protein B0H10DRAFT_1956858 [Mycena sp. CBHHK59/15]